MSQTFSEDVIANIVSISDRDVPSVHRCGNVDRSRSFRQPAFKGLHEGMDKQQMLIAILEAQTRQFEMVVDSISQGICLFDVDERLILCNRRYAEIYHVAPENLQPGVTLSEIVEHRLAAGTTPADTSAYLDFARLVNFESLSRTWTAALKDGRTIQIVHHPIPEGGWLATHEDITEIAASRVIASERVSLQTLIDWIPDYLWIKDTESRFLVVNKALADDCGRQTGDMIGLTDFDLHGQELGQKFRASEQEVLLSGLPMIGKEELVAVSSGADKWLASTKVPVRNAQNEVFGLVGIARDITERKLAEDRIQFMANHDALTGLPNRALMKDRLSQAILYAQQSECWVSVLFIDLDFFKLVNDTLGHNAGDVLLKTIASRMVDCVKPTDTVVRLGGDEFVILLFDQAPNVDDVAETVQKIRTAIGCSIDIGKHHLKTTASIGIANYPSDGADVDTLLANADAAMYRAKELGRDKFTFYAPEFNAMVQEKFLLHEELRNALVRDEFMLLYQPQLDLRSGKVFAVEALIRWNHPRLGLISPVNFIPTAEENGLIVPIGDWVLHEACRQNKAWQDAGLLPMVVAVNVSARQFKESNLVNRVVAALTESGLEGRYLELELTESLIMQDVDTALDTMNRLQEIGVQIAIDDFGTGYSSLSALKTFPVARLKIDKSFINNLATDRSDQAVASAVISLGKNLNLRVIAEGVETDDQIAFLLKNNCDEMQGYHFSQPISPAEIAQLL